MARLHRDRRASGRIPADQELTWTIALDLAHLADVARVDDDLRGYSTAVRQLRTVLGEVTDPDDGASGGEPAAEPDPYGDPPEVGDGSDP